MFNIRYIWSCVLLLVVFLPCVVLAAPSVTSVTPSPSTSLDISSNFIVAFSENMDPSTITGTSVQLFESMDCETITGTTAASVSYNAGTKNATLTPTAALLYNTPYCLTVSGASNASGVPLASPATFSYTTKALLLDPRPGSPSVELNNSIYVTFTEAMDANTISGTTFRVSAQGGDTLGTVTYNPDLKRATFDPVALLDAGTEYTATLSTGIRTVANSRNLPADVVWKFTTRIPLVTVTGTSPAANATEVAQSTTIQAFFSQPTPEITINATTVNADTFKVTSVGGQVAGTVTYVSQSNSANFAPATALAEGVTYTASISSNVRDSLERSIVPYTWNFTTLIPPVKARVLPSGPWLSFDSLQTAYDSGNIGSTTEMRARVFTLNGAFDLNEQISVLLRGGCDTNFNPTAGYTTLNGVLTVISGDLTVENLIVSSL